MPQTGENESPRTAETGSPIDPMFSPQPGPPGAVSPPPVSAPFAVAGQRPALAPLYVVLTALVGFGAWARLNAFGYPRTLQFDEHHFVENARNYLRHVADWNDHPPFGKLILAAAIRLFGDNATAWRLPSLVFGFLTIALGAWAAARLFRDRLAGYFAAAFLGADGFLIAYSRTALLDGFLGTSAVATLLLCSFRLSWLTATLAGALIAFAISIKFSGIAVVPPLLVAWTIQGTWNTKRGLQAGVGLLMAAAAFIGLYHVGLALANQPQGIADVVRDVQRLLTHHAGLTEMKNPATSGWITWLLPTRPLRLGLTETGGEVRMLSMLGNLAIWWSAMFVALATAWMVLKHGTAAVAKRGPTTATATASSTTAAVTPTATDVSGGINGARGRLRPAWSLGPWIQRFALGQGQAVLVILAGALAFLAPWVITHRDSYLYHFLPSYAGLVILLSGFVGWVAHRSARTALGFSVVVLIVAAFYGPIWTYLPITAEAARYRLFLPSWR